MIAIDPADARPYPRQCTLAFAAYHKKILPRYQAFVKRFFLLYYFY